MGFNVGRVLRLEWDDGTDLAGAVIVMKSTPIGVVLQIEEDRTMTEVAGIFVKYVKEWNLEYEEPDEDSKLPGAMRPIPITHEGVLEHVERPMLMEFIKQWHRAALGITAPLVLSSGDGEPSPDTEPEELSIPMEPLSAPLAS